MRALVLEGPGRLRADELPVPIPGPGDVLIRVEAATTCGTDLKAWRRGHPLIPMPGVFGHEYSGVVAAVGDLANFQEGQSVMGVHSAPCQTCEWCLRGQENLCETLLDTMVLGSFAEYLLIPARIARLNLFEKPESLPFDQASLLEPLACVAHGVAHLTDMPAFQPKSLLVIGPGAIGLMFVAAFRHLGVARVVLAGRNDERLAVGRSLGAETRKWTEIEPGADAMFDAVIECTGQVEVWERALDFVRRGGVLMPFGGPPGGSRACFPTARVHYDEISILSPFHFGTRAVRQAREWLLHRDFDLSPLLSGFRRLNEAPQVFEDLAAGRGIKYVFRP